MEEVVGREIFEQVAKSSLDHERKDDGLGLIEKADPTITWSRFQSIIKHFRDRRILQGKTTLFLVPRTLHIYLWLQFWQHYGEGFDLAALLAVLPESLSRWFTEMFKYGHASPDCMTRIEQITASGGPFDDRQFMQTAGSVFLNELAEAHPEAVLRCIEQTIGSWPHEVLVEFTQQRQYLVWGLEKIAIWKEYFQRAARMLLKLAAAENASNGNNATGTFCGLFQMGYGRMASTEAPPATRLPVIREALASNERAVRDIGLQALKRAVADHPYSKMTGPERQGIRPPPKLWTPKVYGEIYEPYRAAWKVLVDHWADSTGAARPLRRKP